MNPLFSIRNLRMTRTQGPGYALVIPELDIREGDRIVLTGPSGCGKSTALDMLGMVLRPDSADRFLFQPNTENHRGKGTDSGVNDIARIWQQGQQGGQDALAALRLRYMGYVLQTGGLLPFLNVYENMALTARLLDLPDTRPCVEALAERLGISRLLTSMPGRLSIGERQRVAIGRALASRPRVILADEPTAALDPFHARTVLDLLLTAVDEAGATLILVTHDTSVLRLAPFRHLCTRMAQTAESETQTTVEAVIEEVPCEV